MFDPSLGIELGFLGNEQDAAAAWAIRPGKIFSRWSVTRGLDDHARSSSSLPHRTQSPRCCTPSMAPQRRIDESLVAGIGA
jgi:hypothetical protein